MYIKKQNLKFTKKPNTIYKMSKRKLRIAQYKRNIQEFKSKAKALLEQMAKTKGVKEFQIISDEYNSLRSKIYVLERKIENLENYKHELGTGDEFGFLDDITYLN